MVMHRALFSWFVLLIFMILLSLRLETRIKWNWFLIFVPLFIYDTILIMDALLNLIIFCKHDNVRAILKNKNVGVIPVVLLKITAEVFICLRLEYEHLQLSLVQVQIPLWIMLGLLLIDLSYTLFKKGNLLRPY